MEKKCTKQKHVFLYYVALFRRFQSCVYCGKAQDFVGGIRQKSSERVVQGYSRDAWLADFIFRETWI